MSKRLTMACCFCKRETVNGVAVGAPLLFEKYRAASHGHCLECNHDFEEGFANETIIARAQARVQHLALAPVAEVGCKQ